MLDSESRTGPTDHAIAEQSSDAKSWVVPRSFIDNDGSPPPLHNPLDSGKCCLGMIGKIGISKAYGKHV